VKRGKREQLGCKRHRVQPASYRQGGGISKRDTQRERRRRRSEEDEEDRDAPDELHAFLITFIYLFFKST
jgi:hypothetical protein